ncbi:MAG TPA: prepilin peptidase [Syntrophomonadaceae bacterium]|nr:prepilin peptidase [Syntrophomonadaceae bacterium]
MILLIFIFGLIIGSFLNVLIYRIPRRESIIWPGSHCAECGHKLSYKDLVPLFSYIFSKGKCRYCGNQIHYTYPLVEIITAVVFVLIFINGGLSVWTLVGWIFISLLIVASFTDISAGIIPDLLTYPGIILGLALSFFTIGIKLALIGSISFSLVFFLIVVLSKGGMGGGDVKLAAVIGAFVGPSGSFLVFVLASLLAMLWVIPLLIKNRATRKTAIKFGPFLAIAAGLAYIYGSKILSSYLSFFGI